MWLNCQNLVHTIRQYIYYKIIIMWYKIIQDNIYIYNILKPDQFWWSRSRRSSISGMHPIKLIKRMYLFFAHRKACFSFSLPLFIKSNLYCACLFLSLLKVFFSAESSKLSRSKTQAEPALHSQHVHWIFHQITLRTTYGLGLTQGFKQTQCRVIQV